MITNHKFMKALGLLFCSVLAFNYARAQQELMLNALPDFWHSNTVNPAYAPEDKRFFVGLPGYALDAAHSGNISYQDVFVQRSGQTVLDFSGILNKLEPENKLYFDQRIETFSLGFRLLKPLLLTAGHANRFSGEVIYPKQLPELIWNGNGPYVGQTLQIGMNARLFDWHEWSVGAQLDLGKIAFGAKVKYLSGISAFQTDPAHQSASVYTDNDIYQLTLNTDYGFHASSLISVLDTSGLGFDLEIAKVKGNLFSANKGAALDLGVSWQLTDKFQVSASVIDLAGVVNYEKNANYYLSRGEYKYDGVTFPGSEIINGADSLDFDTKLDTLNDIFNFAKSPESFSTALPEKIYANAAYKLSNRWTIGVGYFTQNGRLRRSGVGVHARWQVMKWLSIGAMYSINNRSAANVGFHAAVKVGPTQLYFLSDNLLNAFTVKSSSVVNLRVGGALMF